MVAEQTISLLAEHCVWVVIPTLNEAAGISRLVKSVLAHADGCVVADAGSRDATRDLARKAGAIVIKTGRGRAKQMNAGAVEALKRAPDNTQLLFLHADVCLSEGWYLQVAACSTSRWGRFDVRLESRLLTGWRLGLLKLIAWFMNERSARTGICTGDQGLLVSAKLWAQTGGGFPDLPLMEDIEISRLLKRLAGSPVRLPGPLFVSPRRWEQRGVLQTMLSMWAFRLRWFCGESAQSLHASYYNEPL